MISFKKSSKFKLPLLIALPALWFGSIALVTILIASFLIAQPKTPIKKSKYNMFLSTPLVLGAMDTSTQVGDSRPAKIDKIFYDHACPLTGLGKKMVEEADKNNIPYWIVAAISFQESSCGKMTPEVNGVESYNAWGWGVYGDNIKMFDNWEHGIKVISKYLSDKFYSQGITNPCEIMKIYTPPSRGSWCKSINYFKETIDTYKSPI